MDSPIKTINIPIRYKASVKPDILKSFPSLIKNPRWPSITLKLRLIKQKEPYPTDVLFDIREFINKNYKDGSKRNGFSERGIKLTIEQVKELRDILPDVIHSMEVLIAESSVKQES